MKTGVAKGGVAVLHTAIADAEGAKKRMYVQVVIVPSTTRTFIRTQIARKLLAKQMTSVVIAIGGFGEEGRTTKRYKPFECKLFDRNVEESVAEMAEEYPILKEVPLAQTISGLTEEIVVNIG